MDATRASESNKPSKQGFIKSISNFVNSHISLFSLEFNEAKNFAWTFFVHVAVLVVAITLFFILCSIGIVAYFWESYRLMAIFGLSAFYLIIIIISLVSLARVKKNTKLFVACKEELAKDKEVFFNE